MRQASYRDLHSTVVLLKAVAVNLDCVTNADLHSTVVLLKAKDTDIFNATYKKFTFYCSSIKGDGKIQKPYLVNPIYILL